MGTLPVLRWRPLEEEDDEAFAMTLFQDELAFVNARMSSVTERPMLGRRAMYSYHIIASSKRHAVTEWAIQLGLGGMAKIGWPGVIVVEGDERNVRVYVDALSRLRWKHFVVRGEQTVEGRPGQHIDDLRALPMGFEEFGTNGMSEFAARCRHCGLEELFMTCMKMYVTGDASGSTKRQARPGRAGDVSATAGAGR